eukprot:m.180724 g.180724  ORF g.180724 m.180724 type:complete len:354 (+) comp14952_c1_seq1:1055-2116(+)
MQRSEGPVKFETDPTGQKILAKELYNLHHSVLFTAPTSEPHLLSLIRKRHNGTAHHLGVIDGSLLSLIPTTNTEVRDRLVDHSGSPPHVPLSRLARLYNWVFGVSAPPTRRDATDDVDLSGASFNLLNNVGFAARLSGRIVDLLPSLGLDRKTETLANVKFNGIYSTSLEYPLGDLLKDLRAVGEFDISSYQGDEFLTLVTRLYYAKNMKFTVENGGNTVTATYDNMSKANPPIAFAGRMLRLKVTPLETKPTRAHFELDSLSQATTSSRFVKLADLTEDQIEGLVRDGGDDLLSMQAFGDNCDSEGDVTILPALDNALDEDVCGVLELEDQVYRLDVNYEPDYSLARWCAIL